MAHWSIAQWRGPTVNQGPAMSEWRGLVVHIAEGSYEGTISWQKNPDANVSSHFVVDYDGKIAQVVDDATTAWTQRAGNGHWLSVENAGFTPHPLTPAQVEANARLLAYGHKTRGWPLQIALDPNGYGLGHHSMGCNWPSGAWGHCDCPGPNIIAQKPAIVARAQQIINGGAMAQCLVRFADDPTEPNQVWLCDGQFRRRVKPEWVGPTNQGPIMNNQVHAAGLLSLLGNEGAVFVSSGDKDVWGLDIAVLQGGGGTVTGPVDLTVGALDAIEVRAFNAAQRAERE